MKGDLTIGGGEGISGRGELMRGGGPVEGGEGLLRQAHSGPTSLVHTLVVLPWRGEGVATRSWVR